MSDVNVTQADRAAADQICRDLDIQLPSWKAVFMRYALARHRAAAIEEVSMIERISGAIGSVPMWDDEDMSMNHAREELDAMARAALAALLEPSEGMVDTAHKMIGSNLGPASHSDCKYAVIVAIQAALDGK